MFTYIIYLYLWFLVPLILLCLFLYQYRFGFKWIAAKRGLKVLALWTIPAALLLAVGVQYNSLEGTGGRPSGQNNFDDYWLLLIILGPTLLTPIAYISFWRGYAAANSKTDSAKKYNYFILALLGLDIFLIISGGALTLRTWSLVEDIQLADTADKIRDLSNNPLITENMQLMQVLQNQPAVPSDVLERWYHNGKGNVGNIARHPHTSTALLAEIATSKFGNDYCLNEIASNPNVSAALLERISDEAPRVAALSPYASLELLDKLSRHPDPYVRSAVGMNENASCTILKRLANDPELKLKQNSDDIIKFDLEWLQSNYRKKCGPR